MTQNTAGQKSQAAAVVAATVPPPANPHHLRKVGTPCTFLLTLKLALNHSMQSQA